MTAHAQGFLLTLVGVLVLTPDTLLVRLVDTDPWTMTAWRGVLTGGCILLGFVAVRGGRAALSEMRALGRSGLAVSVLYAVNAVTFVLGLAHTSVANVLVILATTPLIAALLSVTVLAERVSAPTAVAIAAGLVGIGIVVWDGLGSGTVLGDLAALITAVTLACTFVIIRRRRDLNMVPAAGVGNLLSALAVLPAAQMLSLSVGQLGFTLIMGMAVLPIAFALLTLGPRAVPAPEVALLLLLETVLGPLWVWLGVGEQPSDAAFLGGGVVVTTLVLHSLWRLRRLQAAASPPATCKADS